MYRYTYREWIYASWTLKTTLRLTSSTRSAYRFHLRHGDNAVKQIACSNVHLFVPFKGYNWWNCRQYKNTFCINEFQEKKLLATDREIRHNGNVNAQTRQRANTPQTEGKILDVISPNSETRSGKEVPQNTVRWLLYKDFLHPYHLQGKQGLRLVSCREEFGEGFLRTCADYSLFPSLILFTLRGRILKSWNAQFPSLACMGRWKSTWKVALRAPVTVLCNVVVHRLLAPYVLPTRPTVYHDLVQNILLDLLQNVSLLTSMHVWFSAMILCCIFRLAFCTC
jgi:hypothetical protein